MPSTDEFTSFGNPELAVWSNRMQGRPGDDPHLVDRLRRGDPRAFEELVIAYQHRVFGVALRMLRNRSEAEEIAQEFSFGSMAPWRISAARQSSRRGSTR